jgi:hypothetical protein
MKQCSRCTILFRVILVVLCNSGCAERSPAAEHPAGMPSDPITNFSLSDGGIQDRWLHNLEAKSGRLQRGEVPSCGEVKGQNFAKLLVRRTPYRGCYWLAICSTEVDAGA